MVLDISTNTYKPVLDLDYQAKRLLGPIGVAIAVVSFGICMYDAALD